jgi:Fe-S cluster biogenesis protein NfuA
MQTAFSSLVSNSKMSSLRVSQLSHTSLQPRPVNPRHRHAAAFQKVKASSSKPDLTPSSSIVTDDAVPEGHKGLHSFLYGEGGAEEAHGTAAGVSESQSSSPRAPYTFHEGEDDGTAIVSTESYLESRDGERPVGVFAVYDSRRNLQYVGYSRNMVLSIRTLLTRVSEDRCTFVRVMVFANKAMQSRAALQREADNWLAEAGTLPPGNGAEQELWNGNSESTASTSFDMTSMSVDELAAYEEKKDKMKRAMGEIKKEENGGDKEDTMDERQAKMRAAMNNGDWSAVIDGQTSEATTSNINNTSTTNTSGPIVTPFARASVHRSIGNTTQESLSASENSKNNNGNGSKNWSVHIVAMTVETVDKVLDDVRPYLIADGGNVDVVSVKNGIVALQLQGACGTCASSSATMKMGIERSLRAAFGEQLKEVISIGGGAVDPSATKESVDLHLNMLRGAISAYGGSVEVWEVSNGKAKLNFTGPKPIGYGMVAAIRDKFHDLKEVVLIDTESGEPIEF